jgi:hypothetical protein
VRLQQRQRRVRRPQPSGAGRRPDYRAQLHRRLTDLAAVARLDIGPRLGAQLAVLVDGMYTSAAHLGPHGPAATGPQLADALLRGRV